LIIDDVLNFKASSELHYIIKLALSDACVQTLRGNPEEALMIWQRIDEDQSHAQE
jgi:hypothetical protein